MAYRYKKIHKNICDSPKESTLVFEDCAEAELKVDIAHTVEILPEYLREV